ncbi:uncharacterized protein PHACADRAFT_201607 [Phanerochaete carnosa HHB-10118-sp]|uniref:Uncharacterized protein n=1 Tax=Phanerochaete carnosa (strain HHB-10118-sp) TaxID=650164 RepID=K5WI56_PHACS|nr:uncharacterized protein PHACADRAFT_201607 [Phanerochaete carnosa HHB-10118-sp]EKM49902.1 hypothetical protein PHACADRAFT_201607 [Phanerochaete carnosa HHB-10118-sp]
MPDFLEIPPGSFRTGGYQTPRRCASGTSYTSWISSLAHPSAPDTPVPVPFDLGTPDSDSSAGTIKLSHAPPHLDERDPETASSETEVMTEGSEKEDAETSAYGFKMSTVEEVSERPTSPPAPSGALRGKARSLVGGLVSSIRSLPRAVTHSQVYDRRSGATTTATSSYGVTSPATTVTSMPGDAHDGTLLLGGPNKFAPAPYPLPFLFAPPYAHPHQHQHHHPLHAHQMHDVHSPLSGGSHARTSKLETLSDVSYGDGAGAAVPGTPRGQRLGGLVRELTALPWISTRVAVDYFPGESRARRGGGAGGALGGGPAKTSSSWYTLTAPATPSDISQPGRLVPEPWFPPARLSPALEVPGEEDEEGGAAEEGGSGAGGAAETRAEKLREELREKTQQLTDLRQVVEHQKVHIGELERELKQLRREKEDSLQRRKSSMRQSMRQSSIRASMRRTSVRVSRPVSAFGD